MRQHFFGIYYWAVENKYVFFVPWHTFNQKNECWIQFLTLPSFTVPLFLCWDTEPCLSPRFWLCADSISHSFWSTSVIWDKKCLSLNSFIQSPLERIIPYQQYEVIVFTYLSIWVYSNGIWFCFLLRFSYMLHSS